MGSNAPFSPEPGLTLRHAALIAGICYLLMPVTYAEFAIFPKLLIPGHIEQTFGNIAAHPQLFGVAIACNLITLVFDVIIAWALYVLLAPVNRSLSLLTAWFRLVYTVLAFVAVFHLVTVYRLVTVPDYLTLFGSAPLHAQVQLLLNSFRYEWSVSLVIFGIHLVLLGYLILRSSYVPKLLGALLVLDGLGWSIGGLGPYLYPQLNFDWFFNVAFVELLLPLWLVIRGWKIQPRAAV